MLSACVAGHLARVRLDEVLAHLAALTEHDRYQASHGIARAAALIAEAARGLGLVDVTVARFPADGATRWWTFRGPRAWTPTTARLAVRAGGAVVVALDHAAQPFALATYAAPTPAGGLVARVVDARGAAAAIDVAGAIAIVDAAALARPERLVARGALGFITDATCRGAAGEHRGRVELDAATPLIGWSVTAAERAAIAAAAVGGATAHVQVEIDRTAEMPVVTAVLPGRGARGEVWLTSHLCHPRPGANDNASGAAALLGVAAALIDGRAARGRDLDRAVRFVWGPEFLGVAALLHQRDASLGVAGRPVAVINLDMIGEDQAQCGTPLVVERPPDWCPSLLGPLAERVVDEVFAQTRAHVGTWRPGPFLGYSDHALFATCADPAWRSPAVQLWHPGDPFNHSAADTLDKVAPIEVRRATTAGAALAELVAIEGAWPRAARVEVIEAWCAREAAAAAVLAERYREVDGGAWSRRFVAHVHDRGQALRARCDDDLVAWLAAAPPRGRRFTARWPGPFNYRGLLAALDPATRADVVAAFADDKRHYALLTHLAVLAETADSRDDAIARASMALRAPVDAAVAARLWAALIAAGWLAEVADDRR